MLKVASLAKTPAQNDMWGDIRKRQITAELTMRF
jgi:hypothetical protein